MAWWTQIFQSTLPTRGSDLKDPFYAPREDDFNPRSPRGGATTIIGNTQMHLRISIHAPHEGERLAPDRYNSSKSAFQSTLPTRGSDALYASCRRWRSSFQSTLPTRGSDDYSKIKDGKSSKLFQSTLPTRGSDALGVKIWAKR